MKLNQPTNDINRYYFQTREAHNIYTCLLFLVTEYICFVKTQENPKYSEVFWRLPKFEALQREHAAQFIPQEEKFIFRSNDIFSTLISATQLKINSNRSTRDLFWYHLQVDLIENAEFKSYIASKIPLFNFGYDPKCPKTYLLAYVDLLAEQKIISQDNWKRITQKIEELTPDIIKIKENGINSILYSGLIILYAAVSAEERIIIQLASNILKDMDERVLVKHIHLRNGGFYIEIPKKADDLLRKKYSQDLVVSGKDMIKNYFELFREEVKLVGKDHHLKNIPQLIEKANGIVSTTEKVNIQEIESYLPRLLEDFSRQLNDSALTRSCSFFIWLLKDPKLKTILISSLQEKIFLAKNPPVDFESKLVEQLGDFTLFDRDSPKTTQGEAYKPLSRTQSSYTGPQFLARPPQTSENKMSSLQRESSLSHFAAKFGMESNRTLSKK